MSSDANFELKQHDTVEDSDQFTSTKLQYDAFFNVANYILKMNQKEFADEQKEASRLTNMQRVLLENVSSDKSKFCSGLQHSKITLLQACKFWWYSLEDKTIDKRIKMIHQMVGDNMLSSFEDVKRVALEASQLKNSDPFYKLFNNATSWNELDERFNAESDKQEFFAFCKVLDYVFSPRKNEYLKDITQFICEHFNNSMQNLMTNFEYQAERAVILNNIKSTFKRLLSHWQSSGEINFETQRNEMEERFGKEFSIDYYTISETANNILDAETPFLSQATYFASNFNYKTTKQFYEHCAQANSWSELNKKINPNQKLSPKLRAAAH